MKKYLLLSILCISMVHTAYAWLVPGTLTLGTKYSTAVSCGSSSASYPTVNDCTGCIQYNLGTSPVCGISSPSIPCSFPGCVSPGDDTPAIYSSCRHSSFWCEINSPNPRGYIYPINYSSSNISTTYFSEALFTRKIGDDLSDYCTASAIGTAHTPPTKILNPSVCQDGGIAEYYASSNSPLVSGRSYNGQCLRNDAINWIPTAPDIYSPTVSIPLGGWIGGIIPSYLTMTPRWFVPFIGFTIHGDPSNCPDTWYNGSCIGNGQSTIITSFNQTGEVTKEIVRSGFSCQADWRYATADDDGPTTTITGTPNVSAVFDGDQNNWCNMTKYVASDYGTAANPELSGCKYYKDKITHSNASDKHPDLLEGLEITVDDTSGVSQILVEIGATCSATYNLSTDVTSVVADSNAASGVKTNFRNIVLKYNSPSINGWGLPSLLSQFEKTRLDTCLTEWKNFIKITTKDNARSNADGVTYSPNTTIWTTGNGSATPSNFIKVDNTGSKIGFTGEAKKLAGSNTTDGSCFIGGATIDNLWKNYTIDGSLVSWDPFGADAPDCSKTCTVLTGSLLTCTAGTKGAKPSDPNIVWTAPGGIDPASGKFTGYTCDGLGPLPDTASCDWGCKPGLSYDDNTKTCVQSSNLFILFNAGTVEAGGSFAAKLTNDPGTSHGLMNSKAATCTAPATGYVAFKYQAWASYNFATAPIGPFPIVENGGVCISPPVAPPPVNGACWSANNTTTVTTPTTNLCTTGAASSVIGTGPWTWTCGGANGGTTANCSATKTSTVVPPPPPLQTQTIYVYTWDDFRHGPNGNDTTRGPCNVLLWDWWTATSWWPPEHDEITRNFQCRHNGGNCDRSTTYRPEGGCYTWFPWGCLDEITQGNWFEYWIVKVTCQK